MVSGNGISEKKHGAKSMVSYDIVFIFYLICLTSMQNIFEFPVYTMLLQAAARSVYFHKKVIPPPRFFRLIGENKCFWSKVLKRMKKLILFHVLIL